jgi:S1-C subfamily serine protease
MTEAHHYEPVPEQRPPWRAGFQPDGSTPERWFEPAPLEAPAADRAAPSRRLVLALLATSLVGAVVGGGATFVALDETGALKAPVAAATLAMNVSVQSESGAIIQAVANVGPSVVTIVTQLTAGQTTGSGIVYDAAGWILTNKHVVDGATGINVQLKDGRNFKGSLYGEDTLTDLAIVKITGATGLSPAPMGTSAGLQVGQLTIAIGSPLGADYANSVSSGIVSALGRDITVASGSSSSGGSLAMSGMIQTDAAISAGNSGGPLVDDTGRVIGVTTTQADTAQGIGFAIPIDIAKPIMQQALAGTKLSRPFIGISYVAIDASVATKYNLPLGHGAWVHKEDTSGNSIDAVTADGPADHAGIKSGDIVVAIEGQAIDATHPLEELLVQYAPGRTVSMELYRGGQYLTVQVTLGTRPDSTS